MNSMDVKFIFRQVQAKHYMAMLITDNDEKIFIHDKNMIECRTIDTQAGFNYLMRKALLSYRKKYIFCESLTAKLIMSKAFYNKVVNLDNTFLDQFSNEFDYGTYDYETLVASSDFVIKKFKSWNCYTKVSEINNIRFI